MSYVSGPKKPASKDRHKPAATGADWHPAEIVAEVRKAGWSLRRLSLKHGYHERSLSTALHRAWPRAEKHIAAAIGLRPQAIWPTRYHADGTPKSGHGDRGIGRPKAKDTRAENGLQRAAA
jgi:Ner family transcriptional regulator